jgi:demethylmenaquinone methyltransferase/2-methoxy-6-polyprenyl-1,4-benzoquinol methylase
LAVNLAQLTKDGVELTGVDYSQPMLEIAAKKAKSLVKGKKISFICGDAASLPFPDAYFDCVGISFAFRNLTYKNPSLQCHLAEVLRVLSPSGRFVILETSQPKSKLVRKLFHLYLRWFVSVVGHLLSGNRGAYCYLAESTARFYTPEKLKKLLVANGFRQVFFQPVFFGVIGIHVAIK